MNSDMKQELERRYEELFIKYHLERPLDAQNISSIIRESLHTFLQDAKKPAIYCNGGHTKMLMADFIHELKGVKYIVDNYMSPEAEKGFFLIRDQEMEQLGIDAIVLSSYKFRQELKQRLSVMHPNIPILDIYDEFEKRGVAVKADYYYSNHPYQHYKRINQLQREIVNAKEKFPLKELYIALVTKYLHIKDFRTAIIKLQDWRTIENIIQEDRILADALIKDIEALYHLQKDAIASISEKHVLMLCLDGLRQQDLSDYYMPKINSILKETGYRYTNAYSYSTSTYESLVPVYSENTDLRSKYYEKSNVRLENCRFASFAKQQGRKIYIYGDAEHFIEGEHIQYSECFLTVTEKLWQFVLDANNTKYGLFYLHESYESHFTFSNPYTQKPLISEGTAMLFDFLPMKGGRLRADYAKQHKDAIRYLDDVLEALLRYLNCRMILYADHGNLILEYDTNLAEVKDIEYTCSEGWTRIPMILRSPEIGTGENNQLISLMELNEMVINLLEEKIYEAPKLEYIKLARSELYNPDFRFLYRMIDKELYLQAFECFVFFNGRKIIIFADGTIELYDTTDQRIDDDTIQIEMFQQVRNEITVCIV